MLRQDQLNVAVGTDTSTSSSDTRILNAAVGVYNANPVLPLPLSPVAEAAGVSRALIYSHFTDQYHLLGAMIEAQVAKVREPVLDTLGLSATVAETAQAMGHVLFDHFIQNGLLLANVTQDDFLQNHLPVTFQNFLANGLRRMSRIAVREYGFTNRQAIAAMLLLAVIPEQAARLVRNGQISEAAGRRGVKRAIRISVDTFAAG